jgi:two-component system, chemotaxis family, protein-glutamate methylesterase/glutaminase
MPRRDIVVIGASAGGVEAAIQLVQRLPANLHAALFFVIHVPANGTSVLPQILTRKGNLHALHPHDKQAIVHGHIYIAPPDHHLLVKRDMVRITRGPRENGHRPAIDPLFRTAAREYTTRVIGVVLTGMLDDGTAGLAAIKECGGIAIVQDPEEAMYDSMPRSAIDNVEVDHILTISEIADLLVRLVQEEVRELDNPPISRDMAMEADMAELDPNAMQALDRPGKPSGFACPECGGVLFELRDNELLRFRCRTGHAYSAETLMAEQAKELEDALWVALRTLEENAALSQRLAERAHERNHPNLSARFEKQLEDAQQRAELIRKVLLNDGLIHQLIEPGSPDSERESETMDNE